MKKCAPGCPAICDFCIWYHFNGDPVEGYEFEVYVDEGYCRLNGEPMEPYYDCPNFVCFNWMKEIGILLSTR